VADIGGGTSDFSLVRVCPSRRAPRAGDAPGTPTAEVPSGLYFDLATTRG
jgi:hypothetical protein